MAINKNAYIRYQTLDKCFSNRGRNYTINDLLDEVNATLRYINPDSEGIKKRQLYDDIKYMESENGFSIELEKINYNRKKIYRYKDHAFNIKNQPLNPAEAENLKSAIQILSRFTGLPQFSWIDEMIPLLKDQFGLVEQKGKIMGFESNIDYTGYKNIKPLFNAINNERVLHVKYRSFIDPEVLEFYFHPYYLKQFNNRWFVFGRHGEYDIPTWNMPLDRILELSETDETYKPCALDWEDYFYDVVGVTHTEGEHLQEIKLRFNAEAKPYVMTKPLHPTQKHKEVDAGLEVRIKVIPNFELEKLILSFGEQVEVLAPAGLRAQINKRFREAGEQY